MSGQALSEVKTWDDREVDTAWAQIEDMRRAQEGKASRGDKPGAGGPQYSG